MNTKILNFNGDVLEVSSVIRVKSNRNGFSIDELKDGTYKLSTYGKFESISSVKVNGVAYW
jgi:hypothetical protein